MLFAPVRASEILGLGDLLRPWLSWERLGYLEFRALWYLQREMEIPQTHFQAPSDKYFGSEPSTSSRGSESVASRFRIELHTSRNAVALPLLSWPDALPTGTVYL